jgi:hypothetical protein
VTPGDERYWREGFAAVWLVMRATLLMGGWVFYLYLFCHWLECPAKS